MKPKPEPRSSEVLVVAGESSGDMHAARLIAAMRALRPDLGFVGIGGERMRREELDAMYDAAQMNVVGFVEVVRRYRFLNSAFKSVVERAGTMRPALAILVDYPGFNIRLARELHALGIPVVYYIAPQVWAWKEGRVEQLRRYVDDLIVAFPFEVEYFRRHGIEARFFGHPLVDQLAAEGLLDHVRPRSVEDRRRTIAYLPGSRPEEIGRHMPVLCEVIDALGPGYRHVIPLASTLSRDILTAFTTRTPFEIVADAHQALATADAALVKSGTSTVETALLGVPFAVIYRTSWLTYQIARRAIRVPSIAMVNILAGRQIVREFVQDDLRADALVDELRALLDDGPYREQVCDDLARVRRELGSPGAAGRAAEHIVERFLR